MLMGHNYVTFIHADTSSNLVRKRLPFAACQAVTPWGMATTARSAQSLAVWQRVPPGSQRFVCCVCTWKRDDAHNGREPVAMSTDPILAPLVANCSSREKHLSTIFSSRSQQKKEPRNQMTKIEDCAKSSPIPHNAFWWFQTQET